MNKMKNHLQNDISRRLSQTGSSPLFLVALVAIGIVAGTLLVQNGVNFIPRADEQEGLNPSAGKTQDCSKVENEAAKKDCQATNDTICFKDTVTYCDNRNGSPRAIRKSGGYYDPSHANTDPKSGCVFDYREVANKDSECGKTESKSGDVVYTTKEEAQRLDSDRIKSLPEREKQSGGSGSGGTTDAKCPNPEATEKAFKDEKVTGNLVRFYAILAGQPNYCVPADLGVITELSAQSTEGTPGRLMLCSGENSSAGNLDLTWRVIVGIRLVPSTKEPPGSAEDVKKKLEEYITEATKVAAPTE